MKQKTAIRQLIEKLEYYRKNEVQDFPMQAINYAINTAREFEPVNEQQIKDAYSAAGHEYYDKSFNESTSVAWFNKTFEKQ